MAEPQTLVVPGSGGSVLAYALPANVLQYVESVVAVIDNSGGADAKPVLSIATGGGTPIADKTQGEAIPGGDTGRATWALRLADEGGGGIDFDKDNEGGWLDVTTNAQDANGFGMALLDKTTGLGMKIENAAAGKLVRVQVGQGAVFVTGSVAIEISAVNGPHIEVQSFGAGSAVLVNLDVAGNVYRVRNHLNQPIFEVRDDGSLHGKTGKTLSFDL